MSSPAAGSTNPRNDEAPEWQRALTRRRRWRQLKRGAWLLVAILALGGLYGMWSSDGVLKDAADYRAQGRADLALREYNKVILFRLGSSDYFVKRAQAHMQLGNYQAAVGNCDWALWLDEDHSEALATRGKAYRSLASSDSSKAQWTQDQRRRMGMGRFAGAFANGPGHHRMPRYPCRHQAGMPEPHESYQLALASMSLNSHPLLAPDLSPRQQQFMAELDRIFNLETREADQATETPPTAQASEAHSPIER